MREKSGKSLLLVEDETLIALATKMRLENYGYVVIIANSGEKALDFVDGAHRIDLVLMDINLGKGMDGTEAAALILKRGDIPVIFLSSHAEPEIVEKTERITSYGYVLKSSSTTVLDASIKMAFKLFEAKESIRQSEERQRVMISNITDVLGIVDEDGIIRYQSPNVERLFGWQPEELVGTDALLLIHPEDIGGLP